MHKLGFKDWGLIVLASSVLVLLLVLFSSQDNQEPVLIMKIEQLLEQNEQLEQRNKLLDSKMDTLHSNTQALYEEKERLKDTVAARALEIDNLKNKLKNEKETSIVMPSDNDIDSVFRRLINED